MESAVDLTEEIKVRSAGAAAFKLADQPGSVIAATLVRLNAGFAQDVLAELPDAARERVLAAAPAPIAAQWQRNAFYDEGAVGRMMESVIAAFSPEQTVRETIAEVRELVKSVLVTYCYVVDNDSRLVGIVTMRDLLFADEQRTLDEIMDRKVFALHAATPLEDAMREALDRHYPVYPVVDAERRLIGLVRGQTMFEARAIQITLQAGSMVGVDKEERVSTPLRQAFRMRHPWLQINLFTAFGTAAVVSMFHGTIERIVVLAAFLPVLSCLAGNNGCQALAITLRGMTLGDLARVPVRRVVARELRLGAMNGFFTGVVGGIAMYFFARASGEDSPVLLGFVMVLAMVVTCVLSCLLGTLVPLAVRKLGADPATASSIFLLTITDIIGMGFMLFLATLFLT
jgi:magnesium transporter